MKLFTRFLLLSIIAVSCNKKSDPGEDIKTPKTIHLDLQGFVNVTNGDFNGRVADNSEDAVTAIMVHKDGSMYADGIFFPSVSGASLDILDGTYTFYVHSYKKGTGYGMEQVNNTARFNGSYLNIENAFSLTPQNVGTYSTSAVVYTSSDSTTVQRTDFPELDAYAADTTILSADLNDGDVITIQLDRVSSGIEIVANNFTEGEISLELVNESIPSNNFTYSLQYPADSAFHIVAVKGTYQFKNVLTKVFLTVDETEELIFSQNIDYHENKIKRFEVNAGSSSSGSGGIFVTYSDEDFMRGDTVRVGN